MTLSTAKCTVDNYVDGTPLANHYKMALLLAFTLCNVVSCISGIILAMLVATAKYTVHSCIEGIVLARLLAMAKSNVDSIAVAITVAMG